MHTNIATTLFLLLGAITPVFATENIHTDSVPEVVVTGVRSQTDVRHLSQTVSVINRTDIEQTYATSAVLTSLHNATKSMPAIQCPLLQP